LQLRPFAEAAPFIAERLRLTAGERGECALALAGGRTPRGVYERLAGMQAVPWGRTRVFWGDERFVPRDHPDSNFRMAWESLLARVPIPAANLHPVPTEAGSAEAAARQYEAALRRLFGGSGLPRFDLVLLGIGEDGHTASLFPGGPECEQRERWCVASRGPGKPGQAASTPVVERVTLTLPVLNAARCVAFLVTGEHKRAAVSAVLSPGDAAGEGPLPSLPAQRVRPSGPLLLFTDLRFDT
jgi:6-phosphogluconolactonase